jgi:hypothetical protein
MNRWRHRSISPIIWLALPCLLITGCLGQDYKSVELTMTEGDHGWLAVIEPDEQFSVAFRENPQYPGVEWTVAEIDSSVIEVVGEFAETPEDVPGEDRTLTIWGFELLGTALGESPLTFELAADGRTVDIAEFTIAVVADACAGEEGITAPRCRRQRQGYAVESCEWEHGRVMTTQPDETVGLMLTANAPHPDAPWELVAYDASVIELTGSRQLDTRTPGDWDTSDPTEPDSFLPIQEFTFTALKPGESSLRFEMKLDGETIEFCERTVVVGE